MNKYNKILTKRFLYKEYIKNHKSTYNIAEETGCSNVSVSNYLKKYNIPIRSLSESKKGLKRTKKFNITKEFLIEEYVNYKKPATQIAKEVGCSDVTILNNLKKYQIKRRNRSECQKLINRKGKNGSFYGKHHTEKNKKKMSNIAKKRLGEKSSNWKGGITKKIYTCIDCDKQLNCYSVLYENAIRCSSCARKFQYKNKPESNPMFGKRGKLSPNYIEGLDRNYPITFKQIRNEIRIRDEHSCQLCDKPKSKKERALDVHHIDYDKDNCKENNLISLCHPCHVKTNYNRDYWYAYFMYITNQEINL